MGASPERVMVRVEANRLTLFGVGRQNLHDGYRVSPVNLRKPLTFYDLLDIEFHYGQSEVSNSENAYF